MIYRLTVLAILTTLGFAADASSEKSNTAIEKALAPAIADASKGYAVYQDVLAKAADRAVKELEKLKADAMKKNDLPLAVAVDAQIKSVKEGALAALVAAKSQQNGDLLGEGSVARVKFDQGQMTDTLGENVVFFQNRGYTATGIGEQLVGLTFTKNAGNGAKDIAIQVIKPGTIYLGVSQDGVDDQLMKTIEKAGWKRQKELDFTVGKGLLVIFSRVINQKMTIPNYGGFSGSVIMAKTAE